MAASNRLTANRLVASRLGSNVALFPTGLLRALAVWWLASVGASLTVGAQGLPWFEVLRNMPFDGVESDLALLFEQWFVGAASESSVRLQAMLLHLLAWRLLLFVPLAWVFAHLGGTNVRGSRLVVRTVVQLPRFVLLGMFWQATLGWLIVTAGGYGLGKVIAPTASSFDVIWGAGWLAFAAMTALIGLTLMDVSRLALFHRPKPLPSTLRAATVAGLELLWRHPRRLLSLTAGYWVLSTAVTMGFGCLASFVATQAPESWGLLSSWLLMQAGVVAAMFSRVAGWRRVHQLQSSR